MGMKVRAITSSATTFPAVAGPGELAEDQIGRVACCPAVKVVTITVERQGEGQHPPASRAVARWQEDITEGLEGIGTQVREASTWELPSLRKRANTLL
jgi:hypothetical protein